MKKYYTNYADANSKKSAGFLHDTLKDARVEMRNLNKDHTDVPMHIVTRMIAPGAYGDEKFFGYYVCIENDSHIKD